jgi:hypothetical protein
MSTKDPKGYYATLGLTPNADTATIKEMFRRKAMGLHPDRNNSPDATRQFQRLNEAYGVLSDPALRAQYDTSSIEAGARVSAATEDPPAPVLCSCCGKMTAQPRYAIFYEVKSFLVMTSRSAIQGIFCSGCADKKALKASAITWLLGWWGFPWGPIYSVHALFNNLLGGQRPANINARLAAHQAWAFAMLGKMGLARAVALDALALARKEASKEGAQLREGIEEFLASAHDSGNPLQLKDSWALFRGPFYIQALVSLSVIGLIWYGIQNEHSPARVQDRPRPYTAAPSKPNIAASRKPTYTRPVEAPNGEPWPLLANYVNGYPRIHANGLSEITIDNSQNDSDVFVKVVSVVDRNTFPVRTLFIPAHNRFTAGNLTAGRYDVRYRDLNTGHLSRSEAFTLDEVPTYDGTQYSTVTMTLYKVRNGNMNTYDISETEF